MDLTVERCVLDAEQGPALAVRDCVRFSVARATVAGIVVESSSGRIHDTTVENVAGDGVVVGLDADAAAPRAPAAADGSAPCAGSVTGQSHWPDPAAYRTRLAFST